MQDFIDKEIDKWLTTSRSAGISVQEANLRAMLERAYEAGRKEQARVVDKHFVDWMKNDLMEEVKKEAYKKGNEAAFEKVRVSLLAFINNNLKQ